MEVRTKLYYRWWVKENILKVERQDRDKVKKNFRSPGYKRKSPAKTTKQKMKLMKPGKVEEVITELEIGDEDGMVIIIDLWPKYEKIWKNLKNTGNDQIQNEFLLVARICNTYRSGYYSMKQACSLHDCSQARFYNLISNSTYLFELYEDSKRFRMNLRKHIRQDNSENALDKLVDGFESTEVIEKMSVIKDETGREVVVLGDRTVKKKVNAPSPSAVFYTLNNYSPHTHSMNPKPEVDTTDEDVKDKIRSMSRKEKLEILQKAIDSGRLKEG